MNKENRERIFDLLSVYESLLTDSQKKAVENHYAYDLSFGEISKEESVSRAAINDLVKTAISKMEEYESKLHLLEVKDQLIKIANKTTNSEIKQELQSILEKYYGI